MKNVVKKLWNYENGKNVFKKLWNDDNGMTTMEIIIGSTLLGGAALLVGYGLTAGFRGKTGEIITDLDNVTAINDPIEDDSLYTYTGVGTSDTGMMTDASGN